MDMHDKLVKAENASLSYHEALATASTQISALEKANLQLRAAYQKEGEEVVNAMEKVKEEGLALDGAKNTLNKTMATLLSEDAAKRMCATKVQKIWEVLEAKKDALDKRSAEIAELKQASARDRAALQTLTQQDEARHSEFEKLRRKAAETESIEAELKAMRAMVADDSKAKADVKAQEASKFVGVTSEAERALQGKLADAKYDLEEAQTKLARAEDAKDALHKKLKEVVSNCHEEHSEAAKQGEASAATDKDDTLWQLKKTRDELAQTKAK